MSPKLRVTGSGLKEVLHISSTQVKQISWTEVSGLKHPVLAIKTCTKCQVPISGSGLEPVLLNTELIQHFKKWVTCSDTRVSKTILHAMSINIIYFEGMYLL